MIPLLHLRRLPLILATSSFRRKNICCSVPEGFQKYFSLTSSSSSTITTPTTTITNPVLDTGIVMNDLSSDTFLLTPRAALRLLTLRKERGQKELRLRIKVESGGCSGFKYEFQIENTPVKSNDPEDVDFSFSKESPDGKPGVPVVIDSISFGFIKGSALDWDDANMMRQSFVITGNPQAESSCGCKSSFAIKT